MNEVPRIEAGVPARTVPVDPSRAGSGVLRVTRGERRRGPDGVTSAAGAVASALIASRVAVEWKRAARTAGKRSRPRSSISALVPLHPPALIRILPTRFLEIVYTASDLAHPLGQLRLQLRDIQLVAPAEEVSLHVPRRLPARRGDAAVSRGSEAALRHGLRADARRAAPRPPPLTRRA